MADKKGNDLFIEETSEENTAIEKEESVKEVRSSSYRRVHIKNESEPEENEYYLSVSRKFKLARYITLLVLISFILVMISFYSEDITLENFRYLLKYFSKDTPDTVQDAGAIYYNADNKIDLGVYKGDIIKADSSGIEIYNPKGELILTNDTAYENPEIKTSERYTIVYDLGGYNYSIFNSFSQLKKEEFLYPINNAVMSNTGTYAIATKAAGYKSALYVYDKNFNRVGQLFKDMYIMDMSMSDDGTNVLISYADTTQNGEYKTELVTYSLYSESTGLSYSIDDTMVMKTGYFSEGGFGVACDDMLIFFDKYGNSINEISYDSRIPAAVLIDEDYVVAGFSQNIIGYNYDINVYDCAGNLLLEKAVHGKLEKIAADENNIYALCEGQLYIISISNGKTIGIPISGNVIDVYPVNESVVSVFTQSGAMLYSIPSEQDADEKIESEEN